MFLLRDGLVVEDEEEVGGTRRSRCLQEGGGGAWEGVDLAEAPRLRRVTLERVEGVTSTPHGDVSVRLAQRLNVCVVGTRCQGKGHVQGRSLAR